MHEKQIEIIRRQKSEILLEIIYEPNKLIFNNIKN